MIALASDYLMFKLANGETVPFTAANITIEIDARTAATFDDEFIRHAANAVFHFFRYELQREAISVAEFAEALEKVLSGFSLVKDTKQPDPPSRVLESDLLRMAEETGSGAELFFFSSLRAELRKQLTQSPQIVRFRRLRSCVKLLIGARRWNERCRKLHGQIVEYLRECLHAEPGHAERALVVD
jgi:hypothetical protein